MQISDQEKKPHAITNQEKKLFLVDKESNWLWVLLFPSYGFATASNKFIDKRESSLNGRKNQFGFQGPLGILIVCPSKHSNGSTGFRIRLARQENGITDKNPQWELLVENPENPRQIQF